MLAWFVQFLVQSERFQFVQQSVDAVLSGCVGGAAQTVGVHVDEVCGRTVGEASVEFAGDGEGRGDDGALDAQATAESLGERGFARAERSG